VFSRFFFSNANPKSAVGCVDACWLDNQIPGPLAELDPLIK